MPKTKKKVTLEDLAGMMARGFADTATKEDLKNLEKKLEHKIDSVEVRLEQKIESVKDAVELLELGQVGGHESRIATLEKDMRVIKKHMATKSAWLPLMISQK